MMTVPARDASARLAWLLGAVCVVACWSGRGADATAGPIANREITMGGYLDSPFRLSLLPPLLRFFLFGQRKGGYNGVIEV